jgi:hypothetical protein
VLVAQKTTTELRQKLRVAFAQLLLPHLCRQRIVACSYVVDAGRAKAKVLDAAAGVHHFDVRWISQASSSQRAGRAGRTGPGHCYLLYSSAVYNNLFPEFTAPEIANTALEGVVLLLHALGLPQVRWHYSCGAAAANMTTLRTSRKLQPLAMRSGSLHSVHNMLVPRICISQQAARCTATSLFSLQAPC